MLKFFEMQKAYIDDYEGYEEIQPKELEQRINDYSTENNLNIIAITSVGHKGLFVLFEKAGE